MRRHWRQSAQSDSDDDHVVAPVLQSVGNLLLVGFLILGEQYLDVVASISQAISRAVYAGDNLLRGYTWWKIRSRKIDVPRIRYADQHGLGHGARSWIVVGPCGQLSLVHCRAPREYPPPLRLQRE